MVTAKLYGRLGNQLFQKAAAIGYAEMYGKSYSFGGKFIAPTVVYERGHSFNELPDIQSPKNIVLDGYWQSEKYFSHCRETILEQFNFKWQHRAGWCSIHVRRGDYLNYIDKHPVVTEFYLLAALEKMVELTSNENFIIFSDDIPWCKRFFSQYRCNFQYSEGKSEKEDLELMSSCEHNIISNSTFSWWGAWLNQNANKIVISPSKDNWFGPGNSHLDTSDIIPDSWIQIKY